MNNSTTGSQPYNRHVYWIPKDDWQATKKLLKTEGNSLSREMLSPCKILKASDKKLMYAAPSAWSRFCYRQGSWYRESDKRGQYVLVAEHRLPEQLDRFYEAKISESDFMPESLPSPEELERLVDSSCYQEMKPVGWEKVKIHEHILHWLVFRLTGFGKWHESFSTYWLAHRANHANFLCKKFTTEEDSEAVAYSISDTPSVCSSCAEFLNVIGKNDKKLVLACPGSIIVGAAKRGLYYKIEPVT